VFFVVSVKYRLVTRPCATSSAKRWLLRTTLSQLPDPLPSLPSAVEAREAVEDMSSFPKTRQRNTQDTGYRVGPLPSISSLYYGVYMFLI
jgi:hypothetical protein